MSSKTSYKSIINFLYEVGTLRKIPRSHMQTLLTSDLSDNISSHSFRVCVIGLMLANLEKANVSKVLTMCLFHDITESRSGDQNWVHKKYVKVFDDEIISDQLKNLPNSKEFLTIIQEYQNRKTPEAIITKDADLLDQILLLQEYIRSGNQEAKNWKSHINLLVTKSAIALGQQIIHTVPSTWWTQGNWTGKRR